MASIYANIDTGKKCIFKVFKVAGKRCIYNYGIERKLQKKRDDDNGQTWHEE
mgnify:CR=1 FL=1